MLLTGATKGELRITLPRQRSAKAEHGSDKEDVLHGMVQELNVNAGFREYLHRFRPNDIE